MSEGNVAPHRRWHLTPAGCARSANPCAKTALSRPAHPRLPQMARELGVASPAPNFDLLLADAQQAQRGPLGGGGGLGPISPVPQPFSALPAQQLAGPAPGQPQPAGLAQRQQQQVQRAQQQAASRPASF